MPSRECQTRRAAREVSSPPASAPSTCVSSAASRFASSSFPAPARCAMRWIASPSERSPSSIVPCYETKVRKSTQPPASCPHRPPCPGCPRFGAPGIPDAALDALAALARETGLAVPVPIEGAPFGYRLRARLAVRGRATSPKIGLFQEGSHRIVDIPRCPIHHPLVNVVAAEARRAIRATGTPPYAHHA